MAKKILFALIPLLVVILLGEAGLRASGWPEVTDAFEHNEPFWIVDPDLKDSPMPHQEEDTSFAVSTNSDGLRTPHSMEKKKNIRIMTLGNQPLLAGCYDPKHIRLIRAIISKMVLMLG